MTRVAKSFLFSSEKRTKGFFAARQKARQKALRIVILAAKIDGRSKTNEISIKPIFHLHSSPSLSLLSSAMFSSLVASFILVASISAAPIVTPTLPYNVAMPGATPAYASIPLPDLLPQSSWIKLIGATTGSDKFTTLLAKRQLSLKTLTGATVGIKCLDGSFSEQDVNSLFAAGGAGTTVLLCPSAVITVLNPIQLSAQRQTLTTLGSPTGSTRATVRVMGATQTAAIVASCGDCHFGAIRNIQVDGSRPLLGQQSAFQSALIQVGGNALNQVVDSVRAFGSSFVLSSPRSIS